MSWLPKIAVHVPSRTPESVTQAVNTEKRSPETRRVESPFRAPPRVESAMVRTVSLTLLIANVANLLCLMGYL